MKVPLKGKTSNIATNEGENVVLQGGNGDSASSHHAAVDYFPIKAPHLSVIYEPCSLAYSIFISQTNRRVFTASAVDGK